MFLTAEQNKLQDAKTQAIEFLRITNIKKDNQFTIQDTSLIFWHIDILGLGQKYIKKENKLEYDKLKKFKTYEASLMQEPSLYGLRIKRDIKRIIGYFYDIYPLLYKEIFKKDFKEELPRII